MSALLAAADEKEELAWKSANIHHRNVQQAREQVEKMIEERTKKAVWGSFPTMTRTGTPRRNT